MARANSHPVARELQRAADSIGGAVPPIERSCFEVSERLGEALPGLNDLKSLFEELAQSLESQEIGAAIDDLTRIADELARAADEITEESQALFDLESRNWSIGTQISSLLIFMRTISSLVFSLKIEAAPLGENGEDLAAFAEGVQELSGRGRRSLDECQATYKTLEAMLSSSCAAQTQFQQRHQVDLRSISAEIVENLGAVTDLRRRTLAALHEIGAMSRVVSERIGQCVVGLQVGDSTRQRIEHAHAAVGLSVGCLDGEAAPSNADFADVASDEERERLVARMSRLMALQLDDALDEFGFEMEAVSASLDELVRENDSLARRGRELFGAGGTDDGSFLATVERKLVAARSIVGECRSARAVVDRAAAAVAATMSDLRGRTEGLSEIVGDVTIIGTNALLKSTRLGDRGKGCGVIAQELRGHSGQIVAGISELPPLLSEVTVCAERVGEVGRRLDAGRLGALDARMSAAIQAFDSNAGRMTAALTQLGREAHKVRGVLDHAVATLAAHADIVNVVRAASGQLDAIASRLGGANGPSPGLDGLLDRMLRPAYSMSSDAASMTPIPATRATPRRPPRQRRKISPRRFCSEPRGARSRSPVRQNVVGEEGVVHGAARLWAIVAHRSSRSERFGQRDVGADAAEDPVSAEFVEELGQDQAVQIDPHIDLDGDTAKSARLRLSMVATFSRTFENRATPSKARCCSWVGISN